jgi:hypothetical protein
MKVMMIAILLMSAVCLSARGQEPSQARDLFRSYSPDGANGNAGAKVRIELLRGSRRSFVSPDTIFRAGDKIKFHFETNFAAFVKIYNRGSSGKLEKLFPYPGVKSRVQASSDYVVPAAPEEWFEFDEKKGVEKIFFSFSADSPAAPAAKPGAKKRPPAPGEKDIVTVRNTEDNSAHEPEEIKDEADWSDTHDLKRILVDDEQYIFKGKQSPDRVVRITFRLQHH